MSVVLIKNDDDDDDDEGGVALATSAKRPPRDLQLYQTYTDFMDIRMYKLY